MAKKVKKAKPQHKGDTFAVPVESTPHRSVEMKKAKNGFVVSSWQDGKEHLYIAKNHKEAHAHASKLLKV